MKGTVILEYKGEAINRANINSRWQWREITERWRKTYGPKYTQCVLIVRLEESLLYDHNGVNISPYLKSWYAKTGN